MNDTDEQEDSGRGARLTWSKVYLAKDRKSMINEITTSVMNSLTDSFKTTLLPDLTISLGEQLLKGIENVFKQKFEIFNSEIAIVKKSVAENKIYIDNF